MTKPPKNHGKPCTPPEDAQLRMLANENTPTRVIGLKLGRSEASVRSHAQEKNLSLKPTNQRPYGPRK